MCSALSPQGLRRAGHPNPTLALPAGAVLQYHTPMFFFVASNSAFTLASRSVRAALEAACPIPMQHHLLVCGLTPKPRQAYFGNPITGSRREQLLQELPID